ncbi:hypothetical protein SH1V18_11950 [Vallitalea longa]|uniref:non-specific serine/threonine protein kinase n=1 Tax=Vallitalea longa TaxID=2936439 RepID=A0A9W5Y9V1_9FIRM|nr:serine/threonine-protein kinase [Vallitalea longa]GKX28715.1 hypothetical protein SH1V18_11950 [Vallitalea longa]
MIGNTYFGKYRVIREIGKGGMSDVFLGENIKLGNRWAIKRVSKRCTSINLLAEPSILKDLNHPLIPQIVDIEEDADYLYIIEEYVQGVNLEEYRKQNKNIGEKTIVDIAMQICDVLEYLHTRKPYPIIFRDLKPGNIMLTDGNKIKFVDFGIAREYKYNSDTDTVLLGTRGFAAPEQYGLGQSDIRTDIYSFGVTLYYLISGNNITSTKKELYINEYGSYSDSLQKIIENCIKIHPNERYQSVKEIKEELTQINDNRKIQANTVYSVMKQSTVGVMSLTKRAGSTFFATNLASALAEHDVLVSLLELPYDEPYIYDLVGISNYSEIDYYPILNKISNDKSVKRDNITNINNILYLVRDPTREKIQNWDNNKTNKLIYSAKDSLISIVDIGFNYANVKNILDEFDLIYVLYDGYPPDLISNYHLIEEIKEYDKENSKVRYILNNYNIGINMKTLNNYLGIKPDITIPKLPSDIIYRCAYKKKFPYKDKKLRNIFDEKFKSIYKELLPKKYLKKCRKRLFR